MYILTVCKVFKRVYDQIPRRLAAPCIINTSVYWHSCWQRYLKATEKAGQKIHACSHCEGMWGWSLMLKSISETEALPAEGPRCQLLAIKARVSFRKEQSKVEDWLRLSPPGCMLQYPLVFCLSLSQLG